MTELGIDDAGRVRRIHIRRPERLNSLGTAHLDALTDAITVREAEIDVLVLTGEGRAFCSGADLSASVDAGTVAAAARVTTAIAQARQPVIAAVNGPAAGVGASIALACDLVVAVRSAYFLLPFLPLGLVPDGGGTHSVLAAGRARATRLALGGERLPAETAEAWGLVSDVVDDDGLEARVAAYTARIVASPEAAAETKRLLRAADNPQLAAALEREQEVQARLLDSATFFAARDAFLARARS
ncbi:enoyl-CoA hydratase/isomerase family protein [Herbiconiux sp. P17]|uniref:enoyl-CoA hydratase/isomerase family protein n=1 Tax=Herbiconiux wuyangfengii TaxID=3342794 RepID=UPI0035BB23EE